MLEFLKYLKSKFPFIWRWIELLNSFVVSCMYGKKLRSSIDLSLPYTDNQNFMYRIIRKEDLESLVNLMNNQPEGFDEYFKPHPFNKAGFTKVFNTKSFIMIGVFEGNEIIGYCFIRCFANGKAFRGKIVDSKYQGRGIAKQMGVLMTNIAFGAGLRLFATISKKNITSIASSKAVNKMKIIKDLKDDYYYIEYLHKE